MTSAVLIDSHPATRIGYGRIFESHPDVELVGCAADLDSLALDGSIDLVIVIAPEGATGFPDLGRFPESCKVIVVCSGRDLLDVVPGLSPNRPTGLVGWSADPTELLFAVDAVTRGGWYVSADLVSLVASGSGEPIVGRKGALAPREIETAVLLAQGLTYRQAARRLGLTEATVTTYAKRARAKLDVANKAAMTKKIIELGYLQV